MTVVWVPGFEVELVVVLVAGVVVAVFEIVVAGVAVVVASVVAGVPERLNGFVGVLKPPKPVDVVVAVVVAAGVVVLPKLNPVLPVDGAFARPPVPNPNVALPVKFSGFIFFKISIFLYFEIKVFLF